MKKPILLLVTFLFTIACSPVQEKTPPVKTGLISEHAMVVTAQPMASIVGKQILANGGNAVDAAIAIQFALATVFPYAGNIGGGGFMVIRLADGTATTLDFRETAPLAADRDMYLDEHGEVIENKSTLGHLASGVPGSVDGMVRAHEKFGSLPWADLVQPAIDLAQNGFKLINKDIKGLNSSRELIKATSTIDPGQYTGKEWQPGDSLVNPDLAATLTRIRDKGRDGFYKGETAKLLIEEMQRGGGIITQADLDAYEAKWRSPVEGTYRGYKITTMPPPSSGGIALIQLLESVEPYALHEIGHNTTDYVHLLVEAERRVYADRAEFLGDMDFYNVPVKELTDRTYVLQRMKTFDPKHATPSDSVGHGIIMLESNETTHFSIIDSEGNAVAVTTTLNGAYGSKVVVGHAGFLLNNEMDDFSIKPGYPNMFGLIGGEANAIEPKKRMLSSMTPTIVEKDGTIFFVTGSPGGSTIITSVFQSILNVIDFNMGALEAVSAPRFHSQWKPDIIMMGEDALDSATIKSLKMMGHKFSNRVIIPGRVNAIKKLTDGKLEGGPDPRSESTAEGF